MTKEIIRTGEKWEGQMSFSQGVKSGPLIFVSGQGALDDDGNVVGKGDIQAQTRKALAIRPGPAPSPTPAGG